MSQLRQRIRMQIFLKRHLIAIFKITYVLTNVKISIHYVHHQAMDRILQQRSLQE